MSNSLKDAFLNLGSALGHCQENSRSIVDALKRGCSDLAENSEGGGGGGSSQDYSTTEHIVGKWIDGTTDVYEITINGTSTISDGTNVDYDLSALNINHIISMECVVDRIVSNVGAIINNVPFYEGNELNASIRYYAQTKTLSIAVKLYSGESTSSQIATIRYTKTS